MRWVACAALGAVLSFNMAASAPAKADGLLIGSYTSSSKAQGQHYKHHKHRKHHRGRDDYHRFGSCHAAAASLWHQGYRRIEARDCSGSTYSFIARSNLSVYAVDVSAASGQITFVTPY